MIKNFHFEGKKQTINFVETTQVIEGVECSVYKFAGDSNKDLGIIRIKAGRRTPLQKVLKGERTIEGYISGKGTLAVIQPSGEQNIYVGKKGLTVEVVIGETMQWTADPNSDLEIYEICFPPYVGGRFENL
jgi:hypothetical protein